jgi:peroxiredoxin
MRIFKRSAIYLLGALVALSLAAWANAAGQATTAGRQIPVATDFKLKDLKGNDVSLITFRGKKVLLVFGATWCPYCVAEIPDLSAFYDRHQDKDVKLIYIDIQESVAKVTNFVQKNNIKYTVLLDTNGDVARSYNVYGIPTIFLIDENGIMKYQGSEPKAGFEELLK